MDIKSAREFIETAMYTAESIIAENKKMNFGKSSEKAESLIRLLKRANSNLNKGN